jgi:hypothetical protein
MQFRQQRKAIVFYLLLLFGLLLVGCSQVQVSEEEFEQQWLASAHADAESRAFTFWADQDLDKITSGCAKCHSTGGYRSFLGVDGSAPGRVSQAIPLGSTIECDACHNAVADQKDSATMPSGVELDDLGQSANCMACHQGRAYTGRLDDAVGRQDVDKVYKDLSLPNIHNNAAGPTQFGTEAKGGYEYEDRAYLGRYTHAPGFATCISCHDPHTLSVPVEKCRACHVEATSKAALQNIRMRRTDFDGDGDRNEGIAGEIETMQERLLLAMRIYTIRTKELDEIVYDNARNPFFFDKAGNEYSTWTPWEWAVTPTMACIPSNCFTTA